MVYLNAAGTLLKEGKDCINHSRLLQGALALHSHPLGEDQLDPKAEKTRQQQKVKTAQRRLKHHPTLNLSGRLLSHRSVGETNEGYATAEGHMNNDCVI